jgi:hypothetical protein
MKTAAWCAKLERFVIDARRAPRRARANRFDSTISRRRDRRHVEICDASSICVIVAGDPAQGRSAGRALLRA